MEVEVDLNLSLTVASWLRSYTYSEAAAMVVEVDNPPSPAVGVMLRRTGLFLGAIFRFRE